MGFNGDITIREITMMLDSMPFIKKAQSWNSSMQRNPVGEIFDEIGINQNEWNDQKFFAIDILNI